MGSMCILQLLITLVVIHYTSSAFSGTLFTIRHEQTSKCLKTKNNQLILANCSESSETLMWKWVTNHRLYNVGSQKCLGLDLSNPQDPLKMFPCDSKFLLWWMCTHGLLQGASMYTLAVTTESVTASFSSNDTWTRNDTIQNVCSLPYHAIYTRDGNSNGKPCELPFVYEGKVYHDCIPAMNETKEWCATSFNYDSDKKWGYCLLPVNDCENWSKNSTLQSCYQYSSYSSVTWKEAYISCHSQGADLLSISSIEELQYIMANEELPEVVWIGLNRLDISSGWQWSDNTPLNFINWHKGLAGFSVLDDTSCGVLFPETGQWGTYPCNTKLPYICKKALNATKSEIPDSWSYLDAACNETWLPYNGFCYKMYDPSVWESAELFCKQQNGHLISFHSLADIELAVTKFFNSSEDIWSGFKSHDYPPLFHWSDGTEIIFTYWDQNEPYISYNKSPNCVSFSGKDWRRHGSYCYLVDKKEMAYTLECDLVVSNKFEQEFINSLIKEYGQTQQKYFWTSLRDVNNTGDYYWETSSGERNMTYSNWGSFQPAFSGGCVAMNSGSSLGKWEVKDCKTFKAQSICKKPLKSPMPEEPLPKFEGACPEGWHTGSDLYCYKLFHYERILNKRTWEEAEGFCEEFGGHLTSFAHLDDLKVFYEFLRLLFSDARWVWVGLNKRNLAQEGSWQWSDNRPVSSVFLPYDFHEEDYDFKDCAAFKVNTQLYRRHWTFGLQNSKEPDFYLKPFRCDVPLEWVCQVPKGAVKLPEWSVPDSGRDSLIVDGEEFWFVDNLHLSYKEAELHCANNGSELASVESYMALTAIQQKLANISVARQNWWVKSINFRDRIHSPLMFYEIIFGSTINQCRYISTDGLQLEYIHFPPLDCSLKFPFVCENRNVTLLEKEGQKQKQVSGVCPTRWIAFGDKCYLLVRTQNATFQQAKEYCTGFGGSLPSIANQNEQDFITSLLPNLTSQFWIGMKITFGSRVNKWADGSNITYSNLNPILHGRLKKFSFDLLDHEKSSQCVFILNDRKSRFIGTWDLTSCAETKNVALCQKPQDLVENQTKPNVPEDEEYQGQKYKILQKNLTWYNALTECKKHQMELVSITDQYQLAFLAVKGSLLDVPMWIGLSSRDDGMNYHWQDGKDVTLNRWSRNEQAKEDCVFMDSDGFWKTLNCDEELPGAFCYFPAKNEMEKPSENIKCPHTIENVPWIPFQNSCYAFLLSHERWPSNQTSKGHSVCRKLHPDAYVLSIRDEEENAFVFDQIQPYRALARWVWLGVIYNVNGKQLMWHDETYVKYSNWRFGRPDVVNNSFYAAMNVDGSWDIFLYPDFFRTLFLKHHSIVACKIEFDQNEDYKRPLPSEMPYENNIYYIIKKRLTWNQAVRECKEGGGNLASMHDDIQQLFLENIVRHDGFPLWIGLSNPGINQAAFEWSDGSTYDFRPSAFSQLKQAGDCVFLDIKGEWKYNTCSTSLEGAICYRNQEEQSKITDTVCPSTLGEGKWIRHKDYCYGFDLRIYNFSLFSSDEAKTFCQTLDPKAVLLTINDEDENQFINRHLAADPFITDRVWLGLSIKSAGKEMKWLDGSAVKYTKWNGVQKDSSLCTVLTVSKRMWDRVDCMQGRGRVVCKAPLKPNRVGITIGFAVFIIVLLIVGLLFYLYKKKRAYFFSSVRYERAEEETESMVVNYN
ncbi:lymphocyte antigen 75 isoform X2 [Bombina bombina]|uniref:lymphocyte antigen 75 isoform X2 n=1 Tax=Bombina bombina TaxID=8345 RepID=UPI00235A9039|nr:lymphocyte antigen 75 isoform X2 [Bombina bombina]